MFPAKSATTAEPDLISWGQLNGLQTLFRENRHHPTRRAGATMEIPSTSEGEKEPDMKFIRKLIRNSRGATAIEYGLIAALIAVAAITAMQGLGTSLTTTFNNVSSTMNG
jgi:pilus assembly protein Flp/PilA